MTMSTLPTSITESSEQSSSPEVSDELIMALTTGQCWVIMEVSSPIWGTWEWGHHLSEVVGNNGGGRRNLPCLVFMDESEKTMLSGFPDATWKNHDTVEAEEDTWCTCACLYREGPYFIPGPQQCIWEGWVPLLRCYSEDYGAAEEVEATSVMGQLWWINYLSVRPSV